METGKTIKTAKNKGYFWVPPPKNTPKNAHIGSEKRATAPAERAHIMELTASVGHIGTERRGRKEEATFWATER